MSLNTALRFWEYIDKTEFDELNTIMKEDVSIYCPNTKEVYRSAESFIEFNKAYPGRWHAEVERSISLGINEAVNITRVYNEDKSFYCISFFEFEGGTISAITQYWGDNTEPPEWRADKGWADTY